MTPRIQRETRLLARSSPGEFIRQVRAENAKVVWQTRKETVTTGIMVLILTAVLRLFFFGVDSAFSALVTFVRHHFHIFQTDVATLRSIDNR